MPDTTEFDNLFSIPGQSTLPSDIMGELLSIQRLHGLPAQEVYYKWESYCIKMGSEETKLDLNTVRAFKKDIQEIVERESRGRSHIKSADKRGGVHATPRNNATGDVFGILDELTPNARQTPSGVAKRKAPYETPKTSKVNKTELKSSPTDGRTATELKELNIGGPSLSFANRANPGQIVETLNDHLTPAEPPIVPPAEPRIKLTANTDLKKFYYKPLAMNLSEASEVLDDRIEEFLNLVQSHHGLEDSAFGNGAAKSTSEVIAVGRIACDTSEGRLNADSMVLETSRRMGAGLRVPLRFSGLVSHVFFPGQIVAVKGINASGDYFAVQEVLEIPLLPPAASLPAAFDVVNERVGANPDNENTALSALNILVSAGPYTADDNLDFEPLKALCEKAKDTYADAVILIGPLLDIEHPLVALGDFDLPDDLSIEPDQATLNDVFRILVAGPLRRLAAAVPSITIIMIPSVRDAVNKHVSWPQEPFTKRELGLPKQAKTVSNPVTISLNDVVVGITAQDILYDLRREEVTVGKPTEHNMLARLPGHVIQQRHFFPMFPPVNRKVLPKTATAEGIATGMPLDVSYLKLGEWLNVRPDVLITPSALPPFTKVSALYMLRRGLADGV
jgi:DNA polymerase alpha subunit B